MEIQDGQNYTYGILTNRIAVTDVGTTGSVYDQGLWAVIGQLNSSNLVSDIIDISNLMFLTSGSPAALLNRVPFLLQDTEHVTYIPNNITDTMTGLEAYPSSSSYSWTCGTLIQQSQNLCLLILLSLPQIRPGCFPRNLRLSDGYMDQSNRDPQLSISNQA